VPRGAPRRESIGAGRSRANMATRHQARAKTGELAYPWALRLSDVRTNAASYHMWVHALRCWGGLGQITLRWVTRRTIRPR